MSIWDIIAGHPGRGGKRRSGPKDSLRARATLTPFICAHVRERCHVHKASLGQRARWTFARLSFHRACTHFLTNSCYCNRGGRTANSYKCTHKSIMHCPGVHGRYTAANKRCTVHTVASARVLLHALSLEGKTFKSGGHVCEMPDINETTF